MTRIFKLPPWFPDWMNKRNLLITLILGIAAAVFAMQTGEDKEAMQFARQGVGQMRAERHDTKASAYWACPDEEKELIHEQEVEVWEPNQTELCDIIGSAEPNEPEFYYVSATISKDVPPDTKLILWSAPDMTDIILWEDMTIYDGHVLHQLKKGTKIYFKE